MIHPNAQKVNANLPNANFPPILLSYLEIALACEVPALALVRSYPGMPTKTDCPYQILRLTKNQGLGRRSCDIVTGVIERAWEYGSGFRTLRALRIELALCLEQASQSA
jgi:hypothetical protein